MRVITGFVEKSGFEENFHLSYFVCCLKTVVSRKFISFMSTPYPMFEFDGWMVAVKNVGEVHKLGDGVCPVTKNVIRVTEVQTELSFPP